MSLSFDEKQAVVAEVSESLTDANAAILAEYRGLTVADMTRLRSQARDAGVSLRVVKNTLARRVIKGTDFECLTEHLVGPVALASSPDPVAVAKVISNFAKQKDLLKVTAGVMNGEKLDMAQIRNLATLPGRDQLLSMLMGTLNAPVQKFVQTLNEVPGRFVRTLAAVRDINETA